MYNLLEIDDSLRQKDFQRVFGKFLSHIWH